MTARGLATLVTVLSVAGPASVAAQAAQQALQAEGRLDALVSEHTAVQAGLGLSVPLGLYLRAGLVLGAGVGRYGLDARSDLIARFSFDPLRQSRWAPYGGGGVSGRFNSTADGGAKAYLLVFAGIEGPLPEGKGAGWVPGFEVGLGGGARIGVVLRRGIHARR
ncbi:MAG TPA: hypothetical protein VNO75_05520 [Gemmatimonadaceae bacterium]|nr:hypothetical protein [Gemmatimonadaceae bacterium]